MFYRMFKNNFSNKFTKYFVLICLLTLLLIFFLIKNEFIYNVINYIQNYLNYYIDKYLNGIVGDLAYNSQSLIYVENDVKNVASSLFLYVVTFGHVIYLIATIIIILIIFNKVHEDYYSEIYQNGIVNKITRIKLNKYINSKIITESIYYGLILLIPKVLYLLILSFFFPVGVSNVHYIDYASYVSLPFLYNAYTINPFIMIILDFIMTFFFGIIIYYISLSIMSLVKNKPLSYFAFIFAMLVICILPYVLFYQVPLIFYNSIFVYYSQIFSNDINVNNIYIPVYTIILGSIIAGIIAKKLLKNGIKRNL